ncbi:MAG: flagellar assembly protein FliW [Candidatus Marinimicrobia bacterium]|nr:flagellar assembly protein FliW [Candidatus Neomarinimicrobiota bacterium]
MKVNVPDFLKKLDVEKIEEYDFKYGLPGFEWIRAFMIADISNNPLFSVLFAKDDPNISMVLMKYLPDEKTKSFFDTIKRETKIFFNNNNCDIDIYFVAKIDKENKKFVANYEAPVVIDRNSKTGYQIFIEKLNNKEIYERER